MRSHKVLTIVIIVLVIAAVAAGIGATMLRPQAASPSAGMLQAGGMQFEIADTPDKQQLGLGNRASIPDNYGMLFVFQKADRYGFWMKDMLAPIDITWLDETGTVILIDYSVDPSTYPHAFYPPVPVKYVLETRAGYAKDHGWDVGTKVPLPAPYGS